MAPLITGEQVSAHKKEGDLWIIIDGDVYDLSKFADKHPGGLAVLRDVAGEDATKAFFSLHRAEILHKPQYARLRIGSLSNMTSPVAVPVAATPYAEPTWLMPGYHSPYYTDNHRRFQAAYRKFIQEIVYPDAQVREEDGKIPSQYVFDELARLNILAMRLGPGEHLRGRALMDGIVTPEEFDEFHELIMAQEGSRLHARGYSDGLGGGTYISLPLIMRYATPSLRHRVTQELLSGKKFSALAVTEAYAGSDVTSIKCRAEKTSRGWLVNGSKKWITNGTFASYFVTACKTPEGEITVLLIERGPGVETKLIRTSYSTAAGTAFVTFENVLVPGENLLGKENEGLHVILSNFNHERWAMAVSCCATMRLITEECMKWTNQRKIFGKTMSSQAVVRSKLASMIARAESCQSWLENITYQMKNMNYKQQSECLAGQIAFLKMYISRGAQDTARDAVQIFGGRGITKTGMGRHVEHFHRTLLIDAVGGGAEDILGDLGVRQALKQMPRNSRL